MADLRTRAQDASFNVFPVLNREVADSLEASGSGSNLRVGMVYKVAIVQRASWPALRSHSLNVETEVYLPPHPDAIELFYYDNV